MFGVNSLRDRMNVGIERDRVFEHDLLPRIDISSQDTPNGRFYTIPDGTSFPSVTTVLGKLSKDGLAEWRRRVGEQVAEEIRYQAAGRGTAVHQICEDYVRNASDLGRGAMPANIATFRQIQPILRERVGVVRGVEYPLYSETLWTAGRTDVIGDFDSIPSIIDFKTSRRKKTEDHILHYFLQLTAYGLMLEERCSGIEVPQIVVVMAIDHEKPAVFIKQKRDYVAMVKEVFRNGKE